MRGADVGERTCSIEDCGGPARSRGMCGKHYQRWRTTGDPLATRPGRWDDYERPACAVVGCERPSRSGGWCKAHYARWWRHGDTDALILMGVDPVERFWSHVEKQPNGCWHWTAGRLDCGYGTFYDGRKCLAHRWSYEHFVGPIPPGLEIDHLCRVRRCVNPSHLEPVTHRENALRGVGAATFNALKTHCIWGHEFTVENTKITTEGYRDCRTCRRRRDRERKGQLRPDGSLRR